MRLRSHRMSWSSWSSTALRIKIQVKKFMLDPCVVTIRLKHSMSAAFQVIDKEDSRVLVSAFLMDSGTYVGNLRRHILIEALHERSFPGDWHREATYNSPSQAVGRGECYVGTLRHHILIEALHERSFPGDWQRGFTLHLPTVVRKSQDWEETYVGTLRHHILIEALHERSFPGGWQRGFTLHLSIIDIKRQNEEKWRKHVP